MTLSSHLPPRLRRTLSPFSTSPSSPPPPCHELPPSVLAARQHNAERSMFASLPTEVLTIIFGYVEHEIERMGLRGTCSRFLILRNLPRLDRKSQWERAFTVGLGMEKNMREYSQRRVEWRRRLLCEMEKQREIEDGYMACYACLTTHPSSCFSCASGSEPGPGKRGCTSWTAPLRLCKHKSLTLDSLVHFKPDIRCGEAHGATKSYLGQCLTDQAILGESAHALQMYPCQCCGGHFNREKRRESTRGDGRGVRLGVVGRDVDEEGRPCKLYDRELCGFNVWKGRGYLSFKPKERQVVVRAETVLFYLAMDERVKSDRLAKEIARLGQTDVQEKAAKGKKSQGAGDEEEDGEGDLCICPHLTTEIVLDMLEKETYEDCSRLENHYMDTIPCPRSIETREAREGMPRKYLPAPSPPTPPPSSLRGTTCSTMINQFSSLFTRSKISEQDQENPCGKMYHCTEKDCETFFYFYRARYTSFIETGGWKDELVLCVVRNLGSCRDPRDSRWLIQLEGTTK